MRLTRQKFQPAGATLNITAMIDVIFLLLIFFMCTTSFEGPESDLNAQIPGAGKNINPQEFEPIRISLTSQADNLPLKCDDHPCDSFEHLRTMLRARRAIADIPVIISGDDAVSYDLMITAMDACYETGFTRAAFSAGGEK